MPDIADVGLRVGDRTVAPDGWGQVAGLAAATIVGLVISGFWNVGAIDGFHATVFAGPTIGDVAGRGSQAPSVGFGILFALVTGLSATATASNLASFSMVPLLALACLKGSDRPGLMKPLLALGVSAGLIGVLFGTFIGRLGPNGAVAFGSPAIRSAQSFSVFTLLGTFLILWAAAESGLLDPLISRCSPITRMFFAQPTTKAAIAGAVIGLFGLGRPLAIFREFTLYTAGTATALSGAALMGIESVGTSAGALILLMLLLTACVAPIRRWTRAKPQSASVCSAAGLASGGSFLIFYWGVSRIWPIFGRWGFRLHWYQ
jgi:hypothetical protein